MRDVRLSQSYAINIEHILRKVFSCERSDVGGIIDSDHIRKYPIASIIHAATYLYAKADSKQKEAIENFIRDVKNYSRWSIDDLLSFESKNKTVDIINYELELENGKQQLEYIIEKFREIIKTV